MGYAAGNPATVAIGRWDYPAHFIGEDMATLITVEEQKAIKRLQRMMNKWPDSLSLFGWSGALIVTKRMDDGRLAQVEHITGVACDGGDPTSDEIDQDPELEFE